MAELKQKADEAGMMPPEGGQQGAGGQRPGQGLNPAMNPMAGATSPDTLI